MLKRRMVWSGLMALLFVVLAVVLPIPAGARIAIAAAAAIEFGLMMFARTVIQRKRAAAARVP